MNGTRRKSVLVTGATGQLGRELGRTAPPWTAVTLLGRAELDVTRAADVDAVVTSHAPDWIINAAAYTAVDRAESEPEAARATNSEGPRALAQAALGVGARLLQVSTDFVFGGDDARPRRPDDPPGPRSVYGRTKLDGERAVVETLGDRAVIVRTAWVYSAQGHNFVRTMLRLLRERGEVGVVADQIGTPTWARGLATAIWRMVELELGGMHHWTDAGVASWYDFAVAIAEEARPLGLVPGASRVRPIATADYPTAAERPACSLLDKQATWRVLDCTPSHWRVGLRAMLRELAAGTAA